MRPTFRWQPGDPWVQLHNLQDQVNQLFHRWGDQGRELFGLGGFPAMNLWEEGDAVLLEAELPGLDLKDLEIFVTGGNQLTVKGERKQAAPEKALWHRQERSVGKFSRTLALPFPVDPERVEAKFENGVLAVRLTKHESARPRKIHIKAE
jgi:HSP20 family protein